MIPLPAGWTEKVSWQGSDCLGRTGYYVSKLKIIYLCPPRLTWLPVWVRNRVRHAVLHLTRKHERGHAHGIDGCKRPWCIMFEAATWRATWKDCGWERWLMTVCGAFTLYGFCDRCSRFLKEKGVI